MPSLPTEIYFLPSASQSWAYPGFFGGVLQVAFPWLHSLAWQEDLAWAMNLPQWGECADTHLTFIKPKPHFFSCLTCSGSPLPAGLVS